MGLDMYLSKKTYVKNWKHNGPEGQYKFTVKLGGKKHPHIKPDRIAYIIEEVGYWRKANHIHQWFVNECQGGIDECQETWVSPEKLLELRGICQTIVDYFDKSVTGKRQVKAMIGEDWVENTYDIDEDILSELLPTASGFFFGGTEYDHWYYHDTKNTVKIIDEALKDVEPYGAEFSYQASW